MRRALDYAKGLGVTLAQHCEVASLAAGGAMHEGCWSSRLGIPGVLRPPWKRRWRRATSPWCASPAHPCILAPVHCGFGRPGPSGERGRPAGHGRGSPTPHAADPCGAAGYDPVFKVNPPLRTDDDVVAVVGGLCDGAIDAVATDHALDAPESKEVPFDQAPPGMLGLETALPIAWEVLSPVLGPERIFALMSTQPVAIARLTTTDVRVGGHSAQGGPVEPGTTANLCVFDPEAMTEVDPRRLASRSRNTPYGGRTFRGAVRHTVLRGEAVVDRPAPRPSDELLDRRGRRAPRRLVGHGGRGGLHRRGGRCSRHGRDRRARVQHGDERLPGGHHRPVLCRPGDRVHEHADRQLRHQRRRRRGGGAPLPRRGGARSAAEPSNWRANEALEPFLRRHGVPASTGVDTRRLARHVRVAGAVPRAFGTASEAELRAAAVAARGTDGLDLVSGVTRRSRVTTPDSRAGAVSGLRIVAYDFGVKTTMVHLLTTVGSVTVVPSGTVAADVLALEPDGVFLSNGPGRPGRPPGPTAAVADLVVARADLRHLSRAPDPPAHRARWHHLKLPFGHHGANHPVQRLENGVVEITSQNHNYAVAADSIPYAETTHVNLNDGVIEGFRSLRAGLLRSVPPGGRTGAARRTLSLRRLRGPYANPPGPARCGGASRGGKATCHAAPTSRPSSSSVPDRSSSVRPASSTTRAHRPAVSCAKRAIGSCWPTESGDDHDRP